MFQVKFMYLYMLSGDCLHAFSTWREFYQAVMYTSPIPLQNDFLDGLCLCFVHNLPSLIFIATLEKMVQHKCGVNVSLSDVNFTFSNARGRLSFCMLTSSSSLCYVLLYCITCPNCTCGNEIFILKPLTLV